MIPPPQRGLLRGVRGVDKARELDAIEDIHLSVPLGQTVEPAPEGARYLGFIFSRASKPEQVERALRAAHECLVIDIESQSTEQWRSAC